MKKTMVFLVSILMVFMAIMPMCSVYADESSLIPDLNLTQYNTPDNEAMQFVEDLKIGWNLGNTFDAIDCTWLPDEMQYEAAWCGVYTTKAMIDALKAKGFNAIRVPVSWHNHVSGNDFEISQPWLNRVQEVVNYCIDNDMYVILNIHHDIDEDYYFPSSTYLENSRRYMTSIWSQLAERFAGYDERLIFESVNEPRLVGHINEWWIDMNNADVIDSINTINTLNQVFVDTVRATGGNNASRYLMCPGYCASSDGAINQYFKLPTDIAGNENKLIVSVHAYTPYNFALQSQADGGTDYWSVNDTASTSGVTGFMDALYNKYTSKGIPVVIGEFGARNKSDNLQSRVEFSSYYIATARARGITCFWWDNNAFTGTGELFGLLDRATCQFRYPEIADGMIRYASNEPELVYGDCNGDGKVNSTDFAEFKRYLLDSESTYNRVLDLNLDNAVNSVDFAIMKQYLLGIIDSIPVN